jgi:hypothetical protein
MYNSKINKNKYHSFYSFIIPERESNQGQQEPKTKDQPLGHGFNENIKDVSYYIMVDWFKFGLIAII